MLKNKLRFKNVHMVGILQGDFSDSLFLNFTICRLTKALKSHYLYQNCISGKEEKVLK